MTEKVMMSVEKEKVMMSGEGCIDMSLVQDDLNHKTSSIFKVVLPCILVGSGPCHAYRGDLTNEITIMRTNRTDV